MSNDIFSRLNAIEEVTVNKGKPLAPILPERRSETLKPLVETDGLPRFMVVVRAGLNYEQWAKLILRSSGNGVEGFDLSLLPGENCNVSNVLE